MYIHTTERAASQEMRTFHAPLVALQHAQHIHSGFSSPEAVAHVGFDQSPCSKYEKLFRHLVGKTPSGSFGRNLIVWLENPLTRYQPLMETLSEEDLAALLPKRGRENFSFNPRYVEKERRPEKKRKP